MPSSLPQEVEILLPLLLSLGTILATIVIHAIALIAVVSVVRHEYLLGRAGTRFWRDVAIVTTATQLALVAHLMEITIWAAVLDHCGEFTRFAPAFYHSAMNYTSLGYGDVVMSASWKLLGPLEAANGLLMFGISTAMIFAVIQRLVQFRFGHQRE
jgi:hypothetical protein